MAVCLGFLGFCLLLSIYVFTVSHNQQENLFSLDLIENTVRAYS